MVVAMALPLLRNSSQCGDSLLMHRCTVALLTLFGLAISADRTGPPSQMSSRILAIFQVGRAKGIAGVLGSDNTACTGGGAHSPAGDSISSEEARDTCPAVLAAATSLALRTS